MSSKDISFGTDGWRAVIAEGFTFENVAIVAQATAVYWNKTVSYTHLTLPTTPYV